MWLPVSSAFWLLVAHETNHTATGWLRLLKLWKRRKLKSDKVPVKHAQREKLGRCILDASSRAEKETCKAATYEVS
jgi:hypothetical protein